jgi:protein FRA10AC1
LKIDSNNLILARSKFKVDTSKHKRDIDVVRENHRFLWEDEEGEEIDKKSLHWEQRIAKKYWDKLFKEYAITDLTQFKSKFL